MVTNLKSKIYYVNNANKIVIHDDNTVFIRSLSSVFTLKGNNISTFTKMVLSKFENGKSINDVEKELENIYTNKSINRLADVLIKQKVLIDEKCDVNKKDLMFLKENNKNIEDINKIGEEIKIGIIASSNCISDILTTFKGLNFIKNINLYETDTYDTKILGQDYLPLNVNIYKENIEVNRNLYNLISDSTFVLVCLEELNEPLIDEINRFTLELNKPWLKAVSNGIKGEIGPLVIPGKTPCYECYKTRHKSNLSEDNLILFNELHNNETPYNLGLLPSFIKINVGILMTEAIRYITGMECELKSNILEINYINYDINLHRLLKVHNCICQIGN